MNNAKSSIQKNLPLIIGAFVLIVIIAGGIVVFVLNSFEYRTAEEYHQHNQDAQNLAASFTKQQASEIVFTGNKVVDQGKDLGCTIGPITAFGSSSHTVTCIYSYSVMFLGDGNLPKEVGEFYAQIEHAGWSNTSGALSLYLDKNGLYIGPGLVHFQKPDSLAHGNYLTLSVTDSKSAIKFSRDPLYNQLVKQYLVDSSAYLFGFTLQYLYVHTTCTQCEESY